MSADDFGGATGGAPGMEPALEVRDIRVAEPVEADGCQRGPTADRAVQDRAARRIQISSVGWVLGIGHELEHPPRHMEGPGYRSLFIPLRPLTKIDQQCAVGQLSRRRLDVEVLDL